MCISSDCRCNALGVTASSEAHVPECKIVRQNFGTALTKSGNDGNSALKTVNASENDILSQMASELSNREAVANLNRNGIGPKFGPRASDKGVMQPGWERKQLQGMRLSEYSLVSPKEPKSAVANMSTSGKTKPKQSTLLHRRKPTPSQSMKVFLINGSTGDGVGLSKSRSSLGLSIGTTPEVLTGDMEEFGGAPEQGTPISQFFPSEISFVTLSSGGSRGTPLSPRSGQSGRSRDSRGSKTSRISSSKRHILHIDPELGLPQKRVELTPRSGQEVHYYQDTSRGPERVYWSRSRSKENLFGKTCDREQWRSCDSRLTGSLTLSSSSRSSLSSRLSAVVKRGLTSTTAESREPTQDIGSDPNTPRHSVAGEFSDIESNTSRASSRNNNSILADEVVASLSLVAPVIARRMEMRNSACGSDDELLSSDSESEEKQPQTEPMKDLSEPQLSSVTRRSNSLARQSTTLDSKWTRPGIAEKLRGIAKVDSDKELLA